MSSQLEIVVKGIENGENKVRIDLSSAGLSEFPRELFTVADTLEFLNLGNNTISTLPSDFGSFKKLKILFFGQNNFTTIQSVLGELDSLEMISFKSNKVTLIEEGALRSTISWLILSDNLIEELPSSIGQLTLLRKCMLAGNKLSSLPDSMQKCTNIELLRISANNIEELPAWLFSMPKLSWLAYAGNPLKTLKERGMGSTTDVEPNTEVKGFGVDPQTPQSNPSAANKMHSIPWSELTIGERIGEGASGYVHRAVWRYPVVSDAGSNTSTPKSEVDAIDVTLVTLSCEEVVAVKLFKGATTSDGLPLHEMKASEALGSHPSFIKVLGRIEGAPDDQLGLVFPLISHNEYAILGDPPSFDTITRDTYKQGQTFSLSFILRCLSDIASAAQHLHHKAHLLHGDLYAHNILTTLEGASLLTDFGAASFKTNEYFTSEELRKLECLEVRAFGCLVEDLVCREEMDVEWRVKVVDVNKSRKLEGSNNVSSVEADVQLTSRRDSCRRNVDLEQLDLLQYECKQDDFAFRPNFSEICQTLSKVERSPKL